MAIRDIFKISRKTFFDPVGWIGYNSISENNRTLFSILNDLFFPPLALREETFEQATQRLNLNEEDLKTAQQNYFIYTIVFSVLGLLTIIFSFYLLIQHKTVHGWLLSLAAAALFFSQAFKYSFWHFQIKYRKLGCTFAEWRSGKPNK